MPTSRTTWEALDKGLTVATDARHTLVIPRAYAHVFTLPKELLEAQSAMLHERPSPPPAKRGGPSRTLSGSLASILRYAGEHADYRMLIAGHAQACQPKEHGIAHARGRASAVHALLVGDRDAFVKACSVHQARDEERALRFVAEAFGYPCDFAEEEATCESREQALRSFRARYREQHGTELPDEADASDEDLGVFYDFYEQRLAAALDTDVEGLAAYRSKLTFLEPAVDACGDFWPAGPHGVERVDIFFFEPPEDVPDYAGDYDKRKWMPGTSLYSGERYVRRMPEELPPEPAVVSVRMTGMYFDTNKSFLLPSAMAGMRKLVSLYEEHPQGELLIVGHTDKSGDPDYNDKLSLERAKAVAAYLSDDADAWLAWYGKDVPAKKRWGKTEDHLMLGALPDAGTHKAAKNPLKSYQASRGLEADGVAGPKTREQLIQDYMALDGTSLPAGITPLAHGCGENFPRFGGAEGESDPRDRRVEMFLFDEEVKPKPAGENSKAGSGEYLRWRGRVVREIVLTSRDCRLESDLALDLFKEMAEQLTPGGFAHWGRAVFGEDIGRAAFEELQRDLRDGLLPPQIEVQADIDGHPAAYDAKRRTILVSEQLVLEARADRYNKAASLACVLVEEFGHFVDDLLRNHYTQVGGDAPEDEGARFASSLLTRRVSEQGSFVVGTLHRDGAATLIEADPEEFSRVVGDLLGPVQQQVDEQQGGLEYADPLPRLEAPSTEEADEIVYLNLLLAGYRAMDAHTLVDLARRLNGRWRGQVGAAVFYESTKPGRPGPALERRILTYLLSLHVELEARIKAAPLAEDGMPDLGDGALWTLDPGQSLWEANSPLGGLLEDIAPFGSQQEWIARCSELDDLRKRSDTRVRQRASEAPEGGAGEQTLRPGRVPEVGASVPGSVSDAASGEVGATPVDDALNYVDRGLGALDTVIGVLELLSIEIAGSIAVTIAGPVLLLATFISGLLKADAQQAAAARAMGVVFAYFTIKKYAERQHLPSRVTEANVEQNVQTIPDLKRIRDSRAAWKGPTPQAVIDAGEKEGTMLVLDALNQNLARVPEIARRAHENMILNARIENHGKSAEEQLRSEQELGQRFPESWWANELRRRVYAEVIRAIETQALAVFNRFAVNE